MFWIYWDTAWSLIISGIMFATIVAHPDAELVEVHAAKRLMSARRDFTIAAWLKTQFRRDAARLEADVAALRMAGLPGG